MPLTSPTAAPAVTSRPARGSYAVLVVDEPPLGEHLSRAAGRWDVRCLRGGEAVKAVRGFRPDAIVLDAARGGRLLPRLRAALPGVPILFLTALDSLRDRPAGLRAGADDYVTRPFSVDEVVIRLRGLLRDAGAALAVGDLTLDQETHEVRRAGQEIRLTPTEFELLRVLMRHPGRALSKAQILDRVWAYDFAGQGNIVELYISYLRRKIDADRRPMIHTLRGVGYVLRPAA
ncbi:DNA-binding response regulator [Nonomuraea sp. WAC 01424]|uniref:response regulator transcription factor n=1 Tax=Nonomuraea sp. WAC 01424 TaxID=2203200 RepID=UPI000F766086|nr:response regulator transcription factor [Nonomuraea sp. WAC 01424]RSM98631.1 DNA-binding response regulator [Nonomuraea sp. WAC 01424]